MAQTDLLRTLPFELRRYVYSYLFSGDGESTVWIRQKPPSEPWLSAVLALPEDPVYLTRYRNRDWFEEIDEAFFQGL